jgi:ribosomal protein S18 acetylase RimI-like enzyme
MSTDGRDDLKGLRIRKVHKDELGKLIPLYLDAYRGLEEYAEHGSHDTLDYLQWLYATCPEGFFVAELDGEVVGFVACNPRWRGPNDAPTCEVHEIVVSPRWRGRGIGRRLMERALALGEKRHCPTATLWVGVGNRKAREWYEKLGFEVVGSWGRWLRMRRPLPAREPVKSAHDD